MFSVSKWMRFLLTISFILSLGFDMTFCQPYYFFTKPVDDRGNLNVFRQDLRTGSTELFVSDTLRAADLDWDAGQNWLYIFQGYGPVMVVNITDRSIRGELPDEPATEQVYGVLFVPNLNVFYVSWTPQLGSAVTRAAVYDTRTFKRISDVSDFRMFTSHSILSDDESAIYMSTLDTLTGISYVEAFSTSSNTVIAKKREIDFGPPIQNKFADDGRKGKLLYGYDYPTTEMKDQQYQLYDAEKGSTMPAIPFPWRSQGHLSPDARFVILEQVDYDTAQPGGEYRPGNVFIFDAATSKLTQYLALPPQGKILLFDNYPQTIYYFNPVTLQSISVSDTTVMPTSGLVDTLIAMKHRASDRGWLADDKFVNELDNGLANAQKHLARGDSANCAREVKTFQDKVNKQYQTTLDNEKKNKRRDKRFVTVEGWKFLFYNAQYILDRLPAPK